ncbi:hypothetical protein SDC9_203718 [bioreactor metagenome]|uniref:Uncharacterized protein n=1 Tax=bioreactor metagenome TaxID=1076179 RepID=A0A645J948_9ZZZZ
MCLDQGFGMLAGLGVQRVDTGKQQLVGVAEAARQQQIAYRLQPFIDQLPAGAVERPLWLLKSRVWARLIARP